MSHAWTGGRLARCFMVVDLASLRPGASQTPTPGRDSPRQPAGLPGKRQGWKSMRKGRGPFSSRLWRQALFQGGNPA